MVFYKNNEWHISNNKVRFTDGGIESTQYIGSEGMGWWASLEKLHDDIKILEFISVDIESGQVERLKEINELGIKDGHSVVLSDYVGDGLFPSEVNHVLKDLENKKASISQGIELSDREINEVVMAMQISNIEIDVLELKLGGI